MCVSGVCCVCGVCQSGVCVWCVGGLNISITGAATGSEAKAVSQSVNSGLVVYRGSVIEVNFLVNNETG